RSRRDRRIRRRASRGGRAGQERRAERGVEICVRGLDTPALRQRIDELRFDALTAGAIDVLVSRAAAAGRRNGDFVVRVGLEQGDVELALAQQQLGSDLAVAAV